MTVAAHAAGEEHRTYRAEAVGLRAFGVLSDADRATVAGVTSRGIFLRVQDRRIVFLSYERYRNPLAVTLGAPIESLRQMVPGTAVVVEPAGIVVPTAGVKITIPREAVWRCPAPSGRAEPGAARLRRLRTMARSVLTTAPERGFGAMLPYLIGPPVGEDVPDDLRVVLRDSRTLRDALQRQHVAEAVTAGRQFLGKGRGLTPSGDDLVIGMLLLLNRWPAGHDFGAHLSRFNALVVEAAYAQTTALSANLIESATVGESDERLVDVVDHIMTGTPRSAACLPGLLQWGASSGIDALAGMAIAIDVTA